MMLEILEQYFTFFKIFILNSVLKVVRLLKTENLISLMIIQILIFPM